MARLGALAAAVLALGSGPLPAADNVLTLATTTSTENSGLLAHIHPDFEQRTGIVVRVVAKGTGASLQLARDGNADVVLVHARKQEDQFVAEGYGVMRRDVMYNDFVIIGPAADPATVRDAKTAVESLRRVAAARATFISRGDNSGTHIKEQELWRRTALPLETETLGTRSGGKTHTTSYVRPEGDWYLSVGQGMGKTINVATEKRAYTLADRGTYYAFALDRPARTDLVILHEGDKVLRNPYGVIAVNPARYKDVDFAAARQYIEWITSPRVQRMIGAFTIQGKVLFHPWEASPSPAAVPAHADAP